MAGEGRTSGELCIWRHIHIVNNSCSASCGYTSVMSQRGLVWALSDGRGLVRLPDTDNTGIALHVCHCH